MIVANLAAGTAVFLDSNILIYYFSAHTIFGPPCQQLVKRIEIGEIFGFTSTAVLSELAHRLMTLEAMTMFGWKSKVAGRLKKSPANVRQLSRFRQAVSRVPQLNIQILTISDGLVETAAAISQQTGLLSNDSLIIAVMQANGLTNLVSSDTDFDNVYGITLFSPV